MAINLSTLLNSNPAQVVTATISSPVSTASTTFVTTGLSATITPSSTSSKVLILVSGSSSGGSGTTPLFTLFRGATQLAGTSWIANSGNVGISFVDSPNTISSTTYTLYFLDSSNPANPVTFCPSGSLASITLVSVN